MSELLSQSERSLVFKDGITENGESLVWKICGHVSNNLTELLNEYETLKKLPIEGVRQPVQRGIYQNKEAFAYKYFEGIDLKELIHKKTLPLDLFLSISLSVTHTLKELHQAGICHLRLNSHNVLYNTQTSKICLIDFSLASGAGAKKVANFESWGSELPFMAPEMTGRLNQNIDARSDLYSLGVIMYEMLCGKVPFENKDKASLIHDILIKHPENINGFTENIPSAIGHLVDKLLAKNPKDRYQTTHGLAHDLELLIEKMNIPDWDGTMNLGPEDRSETFFLSDHLYGRQKTLDQLTHLFDSIGQGGSKTCMILSLPGAGKTSLVNTFKKKVQMQGALMLTGKFDRQEQNSPHQAMVAALKEFATYMISRPEEEMKQWKALLGRAVGNMGSVLVELVPEFEWILEKSEAGPELTVNQMVSRINFLFQRIIEEVATPTRPLVLFFDDMQWADPSSIKSLVSIIGNRYIDHFLFIGAYRSDDATQNAPPALEEILKERPDTKEIYLDNLSLKQVHQLIKDSITVENSFELSELVHLKTFGNPFFVKKFLENLQEKGILRYRPASKTWVWDAAQAREVQTSDNVIDFMAEKVRALDPFHQTILRAAFVGGKFSGQIIDNMESRYAGEIQSALEFLCSEDLIEKNKDNTYRFVHDRVQQVAYDLVQGEASDRLHYNLAKAMDDKGTGSHGSTTLFELARHYNLSKEFHQESERNHIIGINLNAGLTAKKTASFQMAFDFFGNAIKAVIPKDWETNYDDTLRLHHEAAETGMVLGHREDAERWLQISLSAAKDINDRIRGHEIKLNHLTETHQFAETIAHLLDVLQEIGYGIKRHPGKLTILREFLGVQWLMRNKKIEDIPQLPPMVDERAKAFLKLTVMATTSIFGHAPDILPIVFFRQVKLSLKYGNSIYSPNSYASYGFAITVFMGNLNKGYLFGKMGLKLVDQLNAEVVKTKVMVIYYGFLAYWKDSLIGSLAPLKEAYVTGRQTGDLLYAAFALSFQSAIRQQAGNPLAEILESMNEDCQTIKNLGQDLVYHITETQRQFVKNLVEFREDPSLLRSEAFEKEILQMLDEQDDQASKFDLYYYKMALAFYFNDYEKAFENSRMASHFEEETTARQIPYPAFVMISALTGIKQLMDPQGEHGKRKLKKHILKKIGLLKSFVKHAPQNYSNKLSLVKAMLLDAEGKKDEATKNFGLSIAQAQTAGFIHEEALVREHFAYFLMNTGNREFGENMLQRAFTCYQKWGAVNKCRQLKEKFPEVIDSPVSKDESGFASFQNLYDLNTIIQANQALSSENSLDSLLHTMIDMVIRNASVSKVVITLTNQSHQQWALAYGDNKEIKLFTEDAERVADLYPQAVINIVTRSKITFISAHLSKDQKYNFDPYIQKNGPVSACALPIITKGTLLGVIYFENNLGENAFDQARVEFFKTITAQLAISLDNVILYSEMEQKVKERTIALVEKNDELAIEKKKSDDLLLNILPEETAEELKNFGKTTARSYEAVTVMFADIRNFSQIAEAMEPEELVAELDLCFKTFDDICVSYGLEKIKTIGDAYMTAGGIPENNKATAIDVVKAALEMQVFTQKLNEQRKQQAATFFEIRIGIHTGPVVAGVVGNKKFQFDIWGNTVNLAARMEQNSEAGRVNISEATHKLVQDSFTTTHRGKLSAKNLGKVDMYFIENTAAI